jgi:O-antigen/teichoic acid export membrane protein/nucleoside-diphosphate-sugar epimerase
LPGLKIWESIKEIIELSDAQKQIACVTGASGTIGRRVVQLLINSGYKVRALSRKENYHVPGAEHYLGGLDNEQMLETFFSGADAVFHCAAELHDETRMWEVNVEGTKRLLEILKKTKVNYFCYLGSGGVVGKTNQKVINEDALCNPQTIYETTKYEAEKLIVHTLTGCRVLILRPLNVVDRRNPGILKNIFDKPLLSPLVIFLKGGEKAHIVHARDVAKTAVHFIARPFKSPACFFISYDHDDHNTFGWIGKIFREIKKSRPVEKIKHPSIHLPLLLFVFIINLLKMERRYLYGRNYSSKRLLAEAFVFDYNVDSAIQDIIQHDYLSSNNTIGSRLLSGSIWAFLGKMVTVLFGFICNVFLARLLDPETLGAYFLVLSIVLFSAIVAQVGTNISVVRFIAEALGTSRPARAVRAVFISLKIVLSGIIFVGFFFIAGGGHWLAIHAFKSSLIASVVAVFTLWIIFAALQNLVCEILRGFSRIDLASIFGGLLTNVLSFIALVLIGLLYGKSNLRQVIIISIVSCGISTICAFWFLFNKLLNMKGKSLLQNKEVLFVSIPLLFTNLLLFVISQIDVWIIGIFAHKKDVAIYGVASRLALLISMPIIIVNAVVAPLIAEYYAKGETEKLGKILRSTATLATIPSFVLLMIYISFGNYMLGFAFGEIYRQGLLSLIILGCGQLLYVCSGSPGLVLMMTGYQKEIMMISLLSLLVSLAGSIVMVTYFGINGVAIATAAGLSLQAYLQTIVARKKADIFTPISLQNLSGYINSIRY